MLRILRKEINDSMKILKRQGYTVGKTCEELLVEEGASRQRKIQAA